MSLSELIVRRLEDFILSERNLLGTGTIRFTHEGEAARGYPYIRSSNEHFERAMQHAISQLDQPVEMLRFLEVGSGIGTKTELARLLGMQATGLDFKQEYVDLAQELFPECTFQQANALDFDYGSFDVVYYHQPLTTPELMFQLERRCLNQLPAPSILVATRLSPQLESQLAKLSQESSLVEIEIDAERLRGLHKQGPLTKQI